MHDADQKSFSLKITVVKRSVFGNLSTILVILLSRCTVNGILPSVSGLYPDISDYEHTSTLIDKLHVRSHTAPAFDAVSTRM